MSIPEAIKGARVSLSCGPGTGHRAPRRVSACGTPCHLKLGFCSCRPNHPRSDLQPPGLKLHVDSPAAILCPPRRQVELAKLPPLQRIPLLARYARIFAAELFGTVLAVPFGLRAFSLHRSLPDARQQRAGSSVSILRNVRYGGGWVGAGRCRAPGCFGQWKVGGVLAQRRGPANRTSAISRARASAALSCAGAAYRLRAVSHIPFSTCRYGSRDRNLMDIYLPPNIELKGGLLEGAAQGSGGAASAPAEGGNGTGGGSSSAGAPVVLFCHGGVWASGSAW